MLYHCFYLRTVLVYETCSGTKLAYINICSRFLIQIFIRFGVGSHANPQIIIGCVSSPQRNWRCTLLPFATCVCASSFSIQIALDFFSLGQLQLFGTCKRAVTGPWKCSPFLTPSNSRSQFFGHKLWVPSINNMWIVRLIYLPAHDDAFEANAQRISSALKPFIEQYVDEIRATKDGYSCSCRKSPWPLLYINVPRPGFCYHWHHWGAAEGGKSFKKNLSSYCWYQYIIWVLGAIWNIPVAQVKEDDLCTDKNFALVSAYVKALGDQPMATVKEHSASWIMYMWKFMISLH